MRRPAIALVVLLCFGCATLRAPASALGEGDDSTGSAIAPAQIELWLESGKPMSAAETGEAAQQARAALEGALRTRSLAPAPLGAGDPVLFVRERAIARTSSHRSEQRWAIAGMVVGVVLVVVVIVASVASGKDSGKSGSATHPARSTGSAAAPAAAAGGAAHAGVPHAGPAGAGAHVAPGGGASAHPPLPHTGPRPGVGMGSRGGVIAGATHVPLYRGGSRSRGGRYDYPYGYYDPFWLDFWIGVNYAPEPMVLRPPDDADLPPPPDAAPEPWSAEGVSAPPPPPDAEDSSAQQAWLAPLGPQPPAPGDEVTPGEQVTPGGQVTPGEQVTQAGQDELPPRPAPPQLLLPAPPELQFEDRGFFSGDVTILQVDLLDRATGQLLWTRAVTKDIDARDAGDVDALLADALAGQRWILGGPPRSR